MKVQNIVIASALIFGRMAFSQPVRVENLSVDAVGHPELRTEFDLRSLEGSPIAAGVKVEVLIDEGTAIVPASLVGERPSDGVAYLVAVDTSGSMGRLLPGIRSAVAEFVGQFGARDRGALITFNDDVKVVVPFTADRSALLSAIQGIEKAGRTTELYYAIHKGLEQLDQAGLPARRVLILISDGLNEGTAYTLDDGIQRARSLKVNAFALGLTGGAATGLLNLQRLGEMTGGGFLRVEQDQAWSEKLKQVHEAINARRQYKWQTHVPADGATHSLGIKITVGELSLTKTMEVTTPAGPPKWFSTPWVLWGTVGGGVVILSGTLIFFVVRQGRKSRAQVAAVEQKLAQEKEHFAKQIEELKEAPASSSTVPIMPAPEPASPPISPLVKKRNTEFSSGRPAMPMYLEAAIEVIVGPLGGSRFPLIEGQTSLGRDDDNHVVIDDGRVSLHHATITKREGTYWIEDLESTNGTFVGNNAKITTRFPLEDGQQIRLGPNVVLRFHGRI